MFTKDDPGYCNSVCTDEFYEEYQKEIEEHWAIDHIVLDEVRMQYIYGKTVISLH